MKTKSKNPSRPKTETVDVTMVLDRSGSMVQVAADTIGGVNTFIKAQRKLRGGCHLTLHQFDTEFETVYEHKTITDAPLLTSATFVPRGNTALNDAIVKAVGLTTARQLAAKKPVGKIIFVIVTDGLENASKEASPEQVRELLKAKTAAKWEIVYVGANQDAVAVSRGIGGQACNSMSYSATSEGTQALYRSISKNVGDVRMKMSATMAFKKADRDEQAKLGVKQ